MKRSLLITIIFALLLCFSSGVLADAAIYDYDFGTVTGCDYGTYVATPDGGVNLREAPTTQAPVLCTIPDFVYLQITQESDMGKGWGYTCYNGYYGWVALSQTSINYPIKEVSYDVVVTAKSGLNLREGPYTTYGSYDNVPYGTLVHVYGTYNDWAEVKYNGTYGWIALKYTVLPDKFADGEPDEEIENIPDEPTEEASVTSLEKEDGGGLPIMAILLGMIVLVVVVAAVLIIVIIAKKK
ncbi:MAG: SH3 domain-containing protein [Firmicutes bacterium]|nr:SH3 domain-containing protein [Bacillota bacterium]